MPTRHSHPLERATHYAVHQVPTARIDETVRELLSRLPGNRFDAADVIYLLDGEARLIGQARLTDILAATADQPLEALMKEASSVGPEAHREQVVGIAVHHGMLAVPIVDAERRFLGTVPAEALLMLLRHEHVEDLHRLAGIRRESVQALKAMQEPPIRRARDRLPWLLVGLAGSFLATYVMSRFEQTLDARVAVAYFVPGIVYIADAIGTQTEAITVRGLSLSHAPLRVSLGGELRTGLLIGLALAVLCFPAAWLGFGDIRLAAAVALSVCIAGAFATSIGLILPWSLARLGRDPAFGSGPAATIIQDVLSLLVYFSVIQTLT